MDAKKKAIIAEMKRHLAEMRRRGQTPEAAPLVRAARPVRASQPRWPM